jgi:hypothetical protein
VFQLLDRFGDVGLLEQHLERKPEDRKHPAKHEVVGAHRQHQSRVHRLHDRPHRRALGIPKGERDDGHDPDEFLERRDVGVESQLGHQQQPDKADEKESGVLQHRELLDQLDAVPGDETQCQNPDEDTGADHPHLVAQGHRRDHVVHAEAQVHQLDRRDRGPESAAGGLGDRLPGVVQLGLSRLVARCEMVGHQVEEIGGTQHLQPGILDDVSRQQ